MNSDRAARARLEAWLDLAGRGWHLFPVRPGTKVPAIGRWEQRATTDPDRLTRFFTARPTHNAGIACGPSGLLVVDCDLPKPDQRSSRVDGREQLKTLAAEHGGLPATWEVFTPSGGAHLYFRAPSDQHLGNTSRLLGPLLDTRGRGGQVLAPGSVLPSGGYALIDDRDPVALPDWITTRLTTPPAPLSDGPAEAVGDRSAYVTAAVRAELTRVRDAGRGGHNAAVFTAARALGQLAAGGLLDSDQARREVLAAAAHIVEGPCDCTATDIAATVRSGLAHGARRPRALPPSRSTSPRAGPPAADAAPHRSHPEDTTVTSQHDHHWPEPPLIAEVAALTARLRALSEAGEAADPAERAAFLADKQQLLVRLAAATDPVARAREAVDQVEEHDDETTIQWSEPDSDGEHAEATDGLSS